MNEYQIAKVFELDAKLIAISKIFNELNIIFSQNDRMPIKVSVSEFEDKDYTLIVNSLRSKRIKLEKELELL